MIIHGSLSFFRMHTHPVNVRCVIIHFINQYTKALRNVV